MNGTGQTAGMRDGGAALDELVARSGDGDIAFALNWPTRDLKTTAAEATRGSLRVCLRGRPVWHGADEATGFEWTARVPFHELLDVLREVGDCITSRLDGVSDNRSRRAIQAWKARHGHNRLRVIEAATGYLPERAPPQLGAGGHRGEPA